MGRTFLVREERRHAGGRKFGQSRCGKTGERQRPDGNERIDTRPRLAAEGDWSRTGHDRYQGFRANSAGRQLRHWAWHCRCRASTGSDARPPTRCWRAGVKRRKSSRLLIGQSAKSDDLLRSRQRPSRPKRHDLTCIRLCTMRVTQGTIRLSRTVDIQIVTASSWREALRRPTPAQKPRSWRAASTPWPR